MIIKDCLDCKHCYIDDIFYEVRCKKMDHPIFNLMTHSIDNYGAATHVVCEDFEEDPDA